jgi:O-antigen ligase
VVSSVNRRCRIALLAAITATPLAIVPGLFLRYFTTPKIVVLYLAAALLLTSLDAWWPGLKMLAGTRRGALMCGSLLAEVVSLLASAALSKQPVLALAGTTETRLGAVTQIIAIAIAAALAGYIMLHRSFTKRVLLAMELAAFIAAVYGIAQYLGWDPLLSAELYTDHMPEAMIRPPAMFGQATYLAAFLLPGSLIAAAAAMDAPARGWLHAVVFGLCTLAIVLTGTRAALLGLALGGLIVAFARVRFAESKRIFKYVATTLALAGLGIGLLALTPLGRTWRVRVSQWAQDPAGGTRLLVWRDSLRLIQEHPFTGIGPATFTGEFRKIQSLELSRQYPDRYHEDPHNLLLGTAVAQGIPGLATLLVLGGSALICGLRCMREGAGISGTLVSAVAAMTIALQFTPLTCPNWLYFVALIALLASTSTDPVCPERPKCSRKPAKILAACTAAVILAIATLFTLQDAAVASTGRSAANGDLERVRESYALSARLVIPSDDLWCSQQIAAMARRLDSPRREAALDLAKSASRRAELNSEMRFVALVQSAALDVITGDDCSAEQKLLLAVRAAPGWYRPHLLLATVLSADGRIQQAKREGESAIALADEDTVAASVIQTTIDLRRQN